MSRLNGVLVILDTEPDEDNLTGTDEHLYLGVSGPEGGREFALATDEINDFEQGTSVAYGIGGVNGGIHPETASDVLASMTISQPAITHVYLRKEGNLSFEGDDRWQLSSVSVFLVAEDDPSRLFQSTGSAWLGNEYGLQVWLAESSVGPELADLELEDADQLSKLTFDHESGSVTLA